MAENRDQIRLSGGFLAEIIQPDRLID